ncbi:hypothetical protein E2C01_032698 [Portunus trituberculatus]|uniref:Uncharacterized protein n=1 Tax=Portunus trituberculatus TaxID=210409 RepID=A0A5B7F236_PORTR|nr:hypothetical protein [Portunus trituberculatus]
MESLESPENGIRKAGGTILTDSIQGTNNANPMLRSYLGGREPRPSPKYRYLGPRTLPPRPQNTSQPGTCQVKTIITGLNTSFRPRE